MIISRYDAHFGGEHEIQRTMLELLNRLYGLTQGGMLRSFLRPTEFEALIQPCFSLVVLIGRLNFHCQILKQDDVFFQIHTSRMTLADDVNLEEFAMTKDEFSGADIKAICTEVGLLALRERRMKVTHADFKKAKEKVMFKKQEGVPEGLYICTLKMKLKGETTKPQTSSWTVCRRFAHHWTRFIVEWYTPRILLIKDPSMCDWTSQHKYAGLQSFLLTTVLLEASVHSYESIIFGGGGGGVMSTLCRFAELSAGHCATGSHCVGPPLH